MNMTKGETRATLLVVVLVIFALFGTAKDAKSHPQHWHSGSEHGHLTDPVNGRITMLNEQECEDLFGGPGWE